MKSFHFQFNSATYIYLVGSSFAKALWKTQRSSTLKLVNPDMSLIRSSSNEIISKATCSLCMVEIFFVTASAGWSNPELQLSKHEETSKEEIVPVFFVRKDCEKCAWMP